MTVAELIAKLEWMAGQVGGECVVKVVVPGKEYDTLAVYGEIDLMRKGYDDAKSETGVNVMVLLLAV